MSIHTEPRRDHEYMVPTVTEIALSPFDHTDPCFMSVHAAADDAMVAVLREDMQIDLALQALMDDTDLDGLTYGG